MYMTIREFQTDFTKGSFNTPDVKVQIEAGWYDWFCSEASLSKKTQFLGKVIAKLEDSEKTDLDNMYVFFKNNCPMQGPLYDDFRICSMQSGDVLYCVVHKDPYDSEKHLWNVYAIGEGLNRKEEYNTYKFRTTKDLVEWFNI